MAAELYIPQLGQTVEEVTIIHWYVRDGEEVSKGQEVLEVETDKAVFDVEATADGFIHIGPYKQGDVVPVLTVVAAIGAKDETFIAPKPTAAETAPIKDHPAIASDKPAAGVGSTTPTNKQEHLKVSPRARKLAAEHDLDPSLAQPTGGGGIRVVEADVRRYLDQQPADDVAERIPLRGIRKATAEHMAASAAQTARVTLFAKADASNLVAYREQLVEQHEEEWGFKPGYNDILISVCARSLKEFPYMNARLNGGAVERLKNINIGLAVDDPRGLFVPVIRDADQKDIRAIGEELRAAVEAIRAGKAGPALLSGGTFTITNLGAYGIDGFTPVINLPEAAILGVGRIAEKAVVVKGKVVPRPMLTLSLAFDHRLIDGAPAARFLAKVVGLIN